MSNNCYRKGKVKRRQHKSRGICPDPAWTRHFTAGFHSVHCWRGASSLCQCHIKVSVRCRISASRGCRQEQPELPVKWAGIWDCSRTKAHAPSGDVWGNVKPHQSHRAIQETLAVMNVTVWQSHVGFTNQCFPKKMVDIIPVGVTGAQLSLSGVRCSLVVRDDSPGWDCSLLIVLTPSLSWVSALRVFLHLWLWCATGTNSMAWEAAQDISSCFPLSNLHPICGGAGKLPSFMNAWDCITSNLGYLEPFLLHIFHSSLWPASLNIWSWVGKITSVQKLEIALNQTTEQAVLH